MRQMWKIGPLLQYGQFKKKTKNIPSDSDVFIVLNEMFNSFYKRHVNYKKNCFYQNINLFYVNQSAHKMFALLLQ